MDCQEKFSRFGELPTEIRLKIWLLAAEEPRTVHLKCQKEAYSYGTGQRFFAKSFTSTTPPPAVLHVCRESRSETLSEYKLSFATPHTPGQVYIAYERDTVRFPSTTLGSLYPEELQSIRSMSLEVVDYPYFAHFNMGILKGMSSLKSLELRAIQNKELGWTRGVLRTLMEDFDEERENFPDEGRMLNIKIVSGDTDKELAASNQDGVWTGGFALQMVRENPHGIFPGDS